MEFANLSLFVMHESSRSLFRCLLSDSFGFAGAGGASQGILRVFGVRGGQAATHTKHTNLAGTAQRRKGF